ncbi:MAG: hypothetical protein ABIU05_06825, partial [Nitrospirales bacterium]
RDSLAYGLEPSLQHGVNSPAEEGVTASTSVEIVVRARGRKNFIIETSKVVGSASLTLRLQGETGG